MEAQLEAQEKQQLACRPIERTVHFAGSASYSQQLVEIKIARIPLPDHPVAYMVNPKNRKGWVVGFVIENY